MRPTGPHEAAGSRIEPPPSVSWAVGARVPARRSSRLIDRFRAMIRNREPDLLDAWPPEAERGLLSPFALGLGADSEAVVAAKEEPWSNGQAEGQINRPKTLKRRMYSRAKPDLLKARMITA